MASGYHLITLFLIILLLFSFTSYSIPFPVEPRDTLNNRCGPALGGNCQSIGGGFQCCSQYGYCGDSAGHCGVGCQPDYGRCTSGSPTAPTTPTQPAQPPVGERPPLGIVPYGAHIYSCNIRGTIALTFDDGPYTYTAGLLDLLASLGIKATFFITGNNLSKGAIDGPNTAWPAVIRRAYNEGHQIASHTWDHLDLNTLNEADRQYQMTRLEQAFLSIIGCYPTYMRAPFIQCNRECLRTMERLGYHAIFWDLDTADYTNVTPDLIQRSKDNVDMAMEGLNSNYNSILSIAHDIHYQTVYNLTRYQIITGYRYGYRFVTVGECLGDPKDNWYRTQS
ncbi:glycoside hydrolase/deacetylase [Morchella conica CCBAS932]|uniref:Glycoside hydrolase/deacetylase n=1 Tax=Morchella conica CCBAS932 TaxID=1392247 RepID=A0A3N4KPX8_9PEZI|nr:glycoside hydrolase/deacetylase [Morchella conica CCBAS932]